MSSRIEEYSVEVRRGPWTVEEDTLLTHYIATRGLGTWNMLAKCAGLKRTGKSCRLRWLNYLKPDIKRGNLTLEEQMLILELHSKWGNRWSRIAERLPGRTDNEIKNYWRTRVQRKACSSSSSSSSQVSVPSQLVPSFSTFTTSVPTDFINISDQQTELSRHKTSPNVYDRTCVNDPVLNGSYHIGPIGLDLESMSAAEGLCNEMTDTLWQWE